MSNLVHKWDLKITRFALKSGITIGISSIQSPSEDFEKEKGRHYVYEMMDKYMRKILVDGVNIAIGNLMVLNLDKMILFLFIWI